MPQGRVVRLVASEGKTRTLQLEDGRLIGRSNGSVSWRNNNPGNLKFEFEGSANKTVRTTRRHPALRRLAHHSPSHCWLSPVGLHALPPRRTGPAGPAIGAPWMGHARSPCMKHTCPPLILPAASAVRPSRSAASAAVRAAPANLTIAASSDMH
jgi:hypothetical protein